MASVSVIVVRIRGPSDEVMPCDDILRKVGVGGVNAGVDDSYRHLGLQGKPILVFGRSDRALSPEIGKKLSAQIGTRRHESLHVRGTDTLDPVQEILRNLTV